MDSIKKSVNYKLAITGAFGALSVILGITRLGMISLSPVVSLTIMHIPVILATLLAGLASGLGVGAIFGISSLILAATSPTGALDPFFVNPLVSVLPRMLIAVITWGIDVLLRKIPRTPKIVCGSISAFFGSLSNTIFVIGSLYLLHHAQIFKAMGNREYFAGLLFIMPNALLEAAAAVIITAAVLTGIYVVKGKKSKLSQEKDVDQN
jgi:uncharacterized membrane protein